jgi:hypothetical protein
MSSFRGTGGWIVGSLLWLLLALIGGVLLMSYERTPGVPSAIGLTDHRELGVAISTDRPTLIVVIHPHCPCSQATATEMGELLTLCGGRLDLIVFLNQPDSCETSWANSVLTTRVEQLPGVRVVPDVGGRLSAKLGATTSGHAVLYGPDRRILFAGGLTPGRGINGETIGRQAILAAVAGSELTMSEASTFGCPLCRSESPEK